MGIEKLSKNAPMNDVFASQLDEDSFVRTVSFIVVEEDGRESVVSESKKKLDQIALTYEFVEVEKNRLPRFIRK